MIIIGSGALAPQNTTMVDQGGAKAPLPDRFKHLKHVDIAEHFQFVTFRTHDSVDGYLKKLAQQNKENKIKQMEVDAYLDQSNVGAYLKCDVLEYFYDFLLSKDSDLYELMAFAIMPNHVHLLIKPNTKLALVMQQIKGSSAVVINKMLGKTDKFLAADYYDRLIRDERHFGVVYDYISNNPLKLPSSIGGAEAPLPREKCGGEELGSGALAPPAHARFYGIYETNI